MSTAHPKGTSSELPGSSIRAHWATRYQGKPYVKGGMGPDGYNCWGLVKAIEADEFGRSLPNLDIEIDALSPRELIHLLREHPEREGWVEVVQPIEGDLVAMGRQNDEAHIGVWTTIDGGAVIHTIAGMGVCRHSLLHIRLLAYRLVRYYRPGAEVAELEQVAA